MTAQETRKQQRWLMLEKFYELADGASERTIIDMWAVGDQLGFDRRTTATTYDYLQDEGLLKAMTLGGGAAITHQGVKEVEDARDVPDRPTDHFPAGIIHITNSHNVNIGSDNTFTQSSGAENSAPLDQLRDQLRALDRGRDSAETSRFIMAISSPALQKSEIAQAAELLAAKGEPWKSALRHFATRASSSGANEVAVKSIEYALQ